MTVVRPLSKKQEIAKTIKTKAGELNFRQGFNFGLGFWTAAFIFSFIIVPAMFCSIVILLSVFGSALGGILPSG